ncbi:UDP-glucose--hexose-1-phosphate uridylyltransferase [Xenorhabdus szentirmaii]|uniref:Galactose-1-phosphate uridylyltransferase n=1 Tax=Xenorhabdus szentirmaii DSM 16338 TaxID=1427518 RepID=W1J6S9_9GAMM|nr:UDP-glucose--hexose-1-phosphate uridylyltransferase [Xenorhabdus szentirmaii]PHM35308.1 galactose-1-phosphate uridylyltransferase [Xenorhabdus szentirmaii DSM 16338]PHM44110.1 galactose-1-phosphate uridylyltransferase [Xenorhabdus szentirmaii]CDL85571.1 Galactose-1-phosphate uridylyltransferase [Xenorhabdus szentirmaii DSM 16338]
MPKMPFNPVDCPHRRYNPLTGKWIIVSPHRAKRPWSGLNEKPLHTTLPSYDEHCFLCPGNIRASGHINPNYKDIYVFQNDYSALLPDLPDLQKLQNSYGQPPADNPLFKTEPVSGLCRVICFSPDHSKTLPELPLKQIRRVIDTWNEQIEVLGQHYIWVQVFENKGEMMGCSQPHPHGQIWASDFLPDEIANKDKLLRQYYHQQGANLLMDYVQAERNDGSRTVVETKHWLAVVPYWAMWPFETMLLPKSHVRRMNELTEGQRDDLAIALKKLICRYDNLFQCVFPYSMGWHFAPFFNHQRHIHHQAQEDRLEHWQLHALFYPPLLRSATVRKFAVGYEMLAELQRDLTPEQAARQLCSVSDIRFNAR